MQTTELSIHFFAQAAVIIAASQGVGRIARRLGQPQVVGEMIAGVMLGPSVSSVRMAPASLSVPSYVHRWVIQEATNEPTNFVDE